MSSERRPSIGRPPLDRRDLLGLFVAYAGLVAVFTAIGLVVKRWDSLVRWDDARSQDIADERTATMNTLSWWGSNLAETIVKIVVTAIVAGLMLYFWRRWREVLMVVVPLVLEAAVFITVTVIVKRPRPAVEQLDGSPVSSSFPSGHVAAAVCYAAIAIVVFWHTRKLWARALAVLGSIVIPAIVGWARYYRGMHHITDIVAGVVLGIVTVVISWWLLERRSRSNHERDDGRTVDHRRADTKVPAHSG